MAADVLARLSSAADPAADPAADHPGPPDGQS
jgi:hypothetical protein